MARLPIIKSQGIYDENNHEWLPDIGHSARKAFRQFSSNERKLRQNREAKDHFNDFCQEMIDTSHIEQVPVSDQFLPVGKYFIVQFGSRTQKQSAELFSADQLQLQMESR